MVRCGTPPFPPAGIVATAQATPLAPIWLVPEPPLSLSEKKRYFLVTDIAWLDGEFWRASGSDGVWDDAAVEWNGK